MPASKIGVVEDMALAICESFRVELIKFMKAYIASLSSNDVDCNGNLLRTPE